MQVSPLRASAPRLRQFKPSLRTAIGAALLLLLGGGASAGIVTGAPVTWNAPTQISGDSDVRTNGTLVGAANLNGATTTVNGVTFQRFDVGNGNWVQSPFVFQGASTVGSTDTSYSSGPYTALSSAYQQLLGTGTRTIGSDSLVFNGLQAGVSYLIQIWANDSAESFDGGYGLEVSDQLGNSQLMRSGWQRQLGDTLTGTFVAAGTSQAVTLGAFEVGVINGFQLRRLDTQTVPEPGSLALAAAALAALGWRRRAA